MSENLKKSATVVRQKPTRYRGILDHANAVKNFQLNRYTPSPDVAAFVEHYWVIHWDLRGQKPYISEVLPFPNINLTFTQERAWITGVATGKYRYTLQDKGKIVGTMFKAGAFYTFWPHPLGELTDMTIPADTVFPKANGMFCQKLLGLNDDRLIVAHLEAMLRAQNPQTNQHMQLISNIVAAIATDRHLQAVQAVAERFDMSERTLQHLFQMYVGVGVKWVIIRFRLQQAAEQIAKGERDYTSIAAELGYSDQAHFARDFKKIVGMSPSKYLKSLQA